MRGERAPDAAPLLVIGVGNPSRGDDALGPHFVERVEARLRGADVALVTDFQLQIEHALDLVGRSRVVFVDASVTAAPPFELMRVEARQGPSVTSHAMSPAAVMEAYVHLGLGPAPAAWVLAIRGERFELGEPLSTRAVDHLDAAVAHFFATFVTAECGSLPIASTGRRFELDGVVQGIGLRPWVYRRAKALGLTGEVKNTARGVTIDAFGPAAALDQLLGELQRDAPTAGHLRDVRVTPLEGGDDADGDFVIADSDAGPAVAMGLPPDLATCATCLADVRDPGSRFHGYPFTSCTDCGPRLTVARTLPYDRATTTLAAFPLCDGCARDYGDPDDRRFHAQTIACPACGPRAWLAGPDGQRVEATDPIHDAAASLRAGQILGVQGLGAFHLVCDATDPTAVAELRRRKRRDAQPFSVMVATPAAAEALAVFDDALRAALESPARPIVLATSRTPSPLAPSVNGPSGRTGVMLPYSPLHDRLVAAAGRPLVVTSGNPSGGPAVITHDEALEVLGPLVDAFLMHDRPIARRVEDSVVAQAPAAGGVRVLRRSRGFAPLPIRLPVAAPEPILAVGAHLKTAACVVIGDLAYLTPHLGDLGDARSEAAWERDFEGFEALLGVRAAVVAHDLHPDYPSTRYAQARPAGRRVGVQHHVAHVMATLAERHVDEPVVGLVFDGTGYGTDGTAWGAEFLLVDGARWTRAATFAPLPLPGGEAAIREVWRTALAALVTAFGPGEALALASRLPVFDAVPAAARATVVRMVETGAATVKARGMGRTFDAVGALTLGLPRAHFDGHVAMALEDVAAQSSVISEPYAWEAGLVPGTDVPELGLAPTLRAVTRDLLDGVAPARVAARFHATIIDATATTVARLLAQTGLRHVVLSGGSFQNRLLEAGLAARISGHLIMAREVPVNDGGIALGQAYAAVLAMREPVA